MSSPLQLVGLVVVGLIAAWLVFQLVVGIISTIVSLVVSLIALAVVAGLAYLAISALA